MTDLNNQIKQRREHFQKLQLAHVKLGATVEALQADRERAGKEAKEKFGVSSFDELVKKRDELEKQNADALARYDSEIKIFEAELNAVSTAVAGMNA